MNLKMPGQSGEAPVDELHGVLLRLPETASALRSRPPEWFGLEPLHADVAITSAFHGLPVVLDLTAPLDGVSPTRRIKSMSLRCVGPEQ